MKRPLTRILLVLLLASSLFAGWVWFRPYAWKPDPAARFHIEQVQFTPDHGSGWLDVFLKRSGDTGHDLSKPVILESSRGWSKAPQDLTLGGATGSEPTDLWLRFWLEPGELDGTLQLVLNDGRLMVKSTSAPVSPAGPTLYSTSRW